MSTLQTEIAKQNNSKILPVKIKIGFSPLFSTFFFSFFSSCRSWHFLESRRAWSPDAVYAHTHTGWLLLATRVPAGSSTGWSSMVCVCGGGGEGVDYDELHRNTASSGFKRKEIFLSGIRPKCSGLHSYSIKKRSIYERFEETVYPEEIKF